jgi:hypothetical protein
MKKEKATHSEMQSNAKHKFERYRGQRAGNRVNSMVIMINPKICFKISR